MDKTLFAGVIRNGAVELPAICLSLQAYSIPDRKRPRRRGG
jgi:hypothetical protein